MNKNIINILLGGAILTGLTACSENDWNDRYLDGFESGVTDSTVDFNYTLTQADYSTIAKAIGGATPEDKADSAIVANGSFPSSELARQWVPTILGASSFDYNYATNGSNALVTYNLTASTSPVVDSINVASVYTLTKEDYQSLWKSETEFVEAVAPAIAISDSLPSILARNIKNPYQGSYAMVSYEYTSTNPNFGGSTTDATTKSITPVMKPKAIVAGTTNENFSKTIATVKDGDKGVTIQGAVTAIGARGFIVTDNSGSLLAYQNNGFDEASVALGDIVIFESATITSYNCALEIDLTVDNFTKNGSVEYSYPTPVTLTLNDVTEALQNTKNHTAVYVALKGKISVSGNNTNILLTDDKAIDYQGSTYYISSELQKVANYYNGQECIVYGYYVANSGKANAGGSKYYQIFVTDIVEVPTLSTTLVSTLKTGDDVTATGIVTAKCKQGFILTDSVGSILYYDNKFNFSSVAMGEVVTVTGTLSAFNGGLQFPSNSTLKSTDTYIGYNYPAPDTITATEALAALAAVEAGDNVLDKYVQFEGVVSISGNYVNFTFPGSSDIRGSAYQVTDDMKAQFALYEGKTVVVRGYYVGCTSSAKTYNVMVTDFDPPMYNVETTTRFALMNWDGTAWEESTDALILQGSDYSAMGITDNVLTDINFNLPIYLKRNLPYVTSGSTAIVAYFSAADTPAATEWEYDGITWNNVTFDEVTEKFTKTDYVWAYNPSVEIYLPYVRQDAYAAPIYQACVDWVYENINKPLGYTSMTAAQGADNGYIDYRGNAEFYSGCSAYYCNVDIRASSATGQYAAGWAGIDDSEIPSVMAKRLVTETFPGALSMLYPEAVPVEGMDIYYTITFSFYTPTVYEKTVKYLVTGQGEFTPVECDFFDIPNDDWTLNLSE